MIELLRFEWMYITYLHYFAALEQSAEPPSIPKRRSLAFTAHRFGMTAASKPLGRLTQAIGPSLIP